MIKTKKLALITIVYWILLVYILAALVWWFIALQQQSEKMSSLLLNELSLQDPLYTQKADNILDARDRKNAQYIGEGATFFILILVGAVFVYRATRRHLRLSMQQQNFMMAVTHELKTPIAVAILNLETMQKRKLDESQQQRLISNTLQEAYRLNALSNNILLASQLEAGGYNFAKTHVNFSDMVSKSVREFSERFPNRQITAQTETGIEIFGETLLLEILVNNLIDNAIKYSPKDKSISIDLFNKNSNIELSVSDQGPGIPESERGMIFEKFYRVGDEQTRAAKGTGLGLYLCSKIAADHKATIRVHQNEPVGSIFIVSFRL